MMEQHRERLMEQYVHAEKTDVNQNKAKVMLKMMKQMNPDFQSSIGSISDKKVRATHMRKQSKPNPNINNKEAVQNRRGAYMEKNRKRKQEYEDLKAKLLRGELDDKVHANLNQDSGPEAALLTGEVDVSDRIRNILELKESSPVAEKMKARLTSVPKRISETEMNKEDLRRMKILKARQGKDFRVTEEDLDMPRRTLDSLPAREMPADEDSFQRDNIQEKEENVRGPIPEQSSDSLRTEEKPLAEDKPDEENFKQDISDQRTEDSEKLIIETGELGETQIETVSAPTPVDRSVDIDTGIEEIVAAPHENGEVVQETIQLAVSKAQAEETLEELSTLQLNDKSPPDDDVKKTGLVAPSPIIPQPEKEIHEAPVTPQRADMGIIVDALAKGSAREKLQGMIGGVQIEVLALFVMCNIAIILVVAIKCSSVKTVNATKNSRKMAAKKWDANKAARWLVTTEEGGIRSVPPAMKPIEQILIRNNIDGEELYDLTRDDLQKMGITAVGIQKKMMRRIKLLHKKTL